MSVKEMKDMAKEQINKNIIGKVTVNLKTVNDYFKTQEVLNDMFSILPILNDKSSSADADQHKYNWKVLDEFKELTDSYSDSDYKGPRYSLVTDYWTKDYYLKNELTEFVEKITEFLEEYTFSVSVIEKQYYKVIIPNNNKEFTLLKKLVLVENIYETFDTVPIQEILKLKTVNSIEDTEVKNALVDINDKSKNEIQTIIEFKKQELKNKEDELKKKIDEAKVKMELEIGKMQLDMAQLMRPVVNEVEVLTDKLYLLENQIYSVLSFLGFTIEIEKLSTGKRAELEEPLVIWQKLRYLDEELPKLASIYEVNFNDRRLFEKILVENEIVKDFFLPNEKTITILQTSKTGIRYYYESKQRAHNKGDKFVWTDYVLSTQDILHAHKLALLIRDGENIYIAWTDEDKIYVNDDNLFYTDRTVETKTEELVYDEEKDIESYIEKDKGWAALKNIETLRKNFEKRRTVIKKPMSRMFVKSIIEGLLEKKDILQLPIKENIMDGIVGKAKYIKFRTADYALKDTKYGTMDDLKVLTEKGDMRPGEPIYIVQSDNGEDRGRGYRNRTHDVSLSVGLTKINLVEYEWNFYAILPVTEEMLEFDIEGRGLDKIWKLNTLGRRIKAGRGDLIKPNNYIAYDRQVADIKYTSHKEKEGSDKSAWEGAYFKAQIHKIENYSSQVPILTDREVELLLEKEAYQYSDMLTQEDIDKMTERQRQYNKIGEQTWRRVSYVEAGYIYKPDLTKYIRRVYVSEEKSYSNSGEARANLQIYEKEYINLTFWNTLWLAYAIRNHHTFTNFYRGAYASQLPHLQKMLDVLRKREIEFVHLLIKYYGEELPAEWQVSLSHWMIKHDYRNFSEFRAKQFAKYLRNQG